MHSYHSQADSHQQPATPYPATTTDQPELQKRTTDHRRPVVRIADVGVTQWFPQLASTEWSDSAVTGLNPYWWFWDAERLAAVEPLVRNRAKA